MIYMNNTYFFDSYALFEIMRGNVNYENFTNSNIQTTKLNLFEVYFGFLKENNQELASISLNRFINFAIDFDKEIIQEAAKFKLKLNDRNVSMVDCIGYILAKNLQIKFLTGDKQFEHFENVEFVKK